MNDGDWVCCDTQCSNVNFARRTSCNRCGKERTTIPPRKKLGHEIGKAAAEKSRGLFSADDWQCGRCGNVNWARRQQCNMCNAPKFGEVEERTGLGGGYNERENVEYIKRDDSDGEYDDFGRKKKKYRGNDEVPEKTTKTVQPPPPELSKAKPPPKAVTQEDEEEEEEDDDEDLSKYDLSGWGDSPEVKSEEKHSRSNSRNSSHSSSRSRSRSSSNSSRSSRSPSQSSSDSEKIHKGKRNRSRSVSPGTNQKNKHRSRSPVHINDSR